MTRAGVLTVCVLLATGCGSSWVDRTPAAGERPRLEPVAVASLAPGALTLPNADRSIKFAVIGDSGRGWQPQHDVAARMAAYREHFPFAFVLMAGDNIYEGPATPDDYRVKFEEPYRALLAAGVRFYAVLGNHDDPRQVHYRPFNMNGHRYYTFTPPVDPLTRWDTRVRFFALDSTHLDAAQLAWFEREATGSRAEWKIALLHHPLYTSGRYGWASRAYRYRLEASFVSAGIDVVFSGHEHLYQRSEPQAGVLYFVTGGAGSLRAGDAGRSRLIARSYDRDFHFMLAEIDDDGFHFQAITRSGVTIDAGSLVPPTKGTAARRPRAAVSP